MQVKTIVSAIALTFVGSAYAQTENKWQAQAGDWHDDANWSLGHFPQASETAVFEDAGQARTCSITAQDAICNNIRMETKNVLRIVDKNLDVGSASAATSS